MDARKNERRSESGRAGRRDVQRRFCAAQWVKAAPQIGKDLDGHPRAHTARIDELAVIGVVAEQQRPEMRPRAFRVGPADDDELLTVQRFGFAPEAAVSRGLGSVDRLGDDALETELAGVSQDKLAVAGLMPVELKARLVRGQRLKKRLALEERQGGNVPPVQVQEIEGVIDEARPSLAVGRGLGLGEARQSGLVDPAELAVDIGGLRRHVGERSYGAWIFARPIEAGSGEELHTAVVDARGHPEAVQFDLVHPLRPCGGLLDRLGKLRRDEGGKRNASMRPSGLDGLRGRTLDDTRHAGQLGCTHLGSPITLENSVQDRDRKHYGDPDRGD